MESHVGQQFASASLGSQADLCGVVLGFQAQVRLSGIHTRGLGEIDHRLYFIHTARLGQQTAGKLETRQWLVAR
jgi:hypothetical protein